MYHSYLSPDLPAMYSTLQNVKCGYCKRLSLYEGALKPGLKGNAQKRSEPLMSKSAAGQSERSNTPLSKPIGRPLPATAPPQVRDV